MKVFFKKNKPVKIWTPQKYNDKVAILSLSFFLMNSVPLTKIICLIFFRDMKECNGDVKKKNTFKPDLTLDNFLSSYSIRKKRCGGFLLVIKVWDTNIKIIVKPIIIFCILFSLEHYCSTHVTIFFFSRRTTLITDRFLAIYISANIVSVRSFLFGVFLSLAELTFPFNFCDTKQKY